MARWLVLAHTCAFQITGLGQQCLEGVIDRVEADGAAGPMFSLWTTRDGRCADRSNAQRHRLDTLLQAVLSSEVLTYHCALAVVENPCLQAF